MNRFEASLRLLSGEPLLYTQIGPPLDLLTSSAFTAARDTSLCESMFGTAPRDTSLCESMFGIHKRAVCDLRRCVLCFLSPYLEILIPLSPRYEGKTGPPFNSAARVRSRGTSQLTARTSHAPNRVWSCTYRPPLAFQLVHAKISCVGPRFRLSNRLVAGLVFDGGSRARRPVSSAWSSTFGCRPDVELGCSTGQELHHHVAPLALFAPHHNPPPPPAPLHPPPALPKSPPTSPPTSPSTSTHLRTYTYCRTHRSSNGRRNAQPATRKARPRR
jgi:hypothetical protein